eukprot:CAMPEP_0197657376 /NCGR_PEP_ID=MMETSP1338-20131121/44585_1 /TAXON_ID=43686 ORGANISM="Pelagodinium beii, Strain RCC1491" /NCGR_SAMPLE_ID=MMETSP1338 /ASSEMBLY_ACC=CAM_ASM_000754 /LENGTH=508 /DNA_ID=CAMNT_0043233723 /DNA_START=38 /DNA_END=1564 /DNA_ORIENTATION=-
MTSALLILLLAPTAVTTSASTGLSNALVGDDECMSGPQDDAACSVQALQLRAQKGQGSANETAVTATEHKSRRSRRLAFCQDGCPEKYGFGPTDCKCSIHGSWYMWVCWKRNGVRIKTEYGKQHSCSGLTKAANVPTPSSPSPPSVSGACSGEYSHNCMNTRNCCKAGFRCYQKNARWAACLPSSSSCKPGSINHNEARRYQTPWSCAVLTPTTTTTTTKMASPYNSKYIPENQALVHPSNASLMTFHLFRVRSDEVYPCCRNADMTSAGAAMFYLHNEIVWHAKKRSGTFFSNAKTRIARYKVRARATQPLYELGMDFGVMNEFDITKCTGPFGCENFKRFGYTVGCENWVTGSAANFPHQKWNDINKYPNASWFSLPGPCPMNGLNAKSTECMATQPGGECPKGVVPTGTGDCTFTTEEAGEITIDELVGIGHYDDFINAGGREYDRITDQGIHTNFWDGRYDDVLCTKRTEHMLELFDRKFPLDPTIHPPECNFNKWKFFPGRNV